MISIITLNTWLTSIKIVKYLVKTVLTSFAAPKKSALVQRPTSIIVIKENSQTPLYLFCKLGLNKGME